jgi:RNA polymerase sigma-70 factor (ECF subfamily)
VPTDLAIRLADLMGRYCDGDPRAFHELYRLAAPRLVDFLTARLPDRAQTDTLLEQCFLRAHRARRCYVRGADPLPWLLAIAERAWRDYAVAT